jgi:hypothetical protein
MRAIRVGNKLLDAAEPDQEVTPLDMIKRQAGQNYDALYAIPRYAREGTRKNALQAEVPEPYGKLVG